MRRLPTCQRFFSSISIACLLFSVAAAEPVTSERIAKLPETERAAWTEYTKLSRAAAGRDDAALKAELAAAGLTKALRAPDGGDFKLSAEPGDSWYASEEAGKLADTVLSYQAPSGGWSKHTGYRRGPRQPGMQWTSQSEPGRPPHYLCTFDNRSTTEQLHFLANMWEATQREDCKAGFLKGLEFIFAAQYPNGGWPQVYPLEGGYHDSITFNDDAMVHILELLQAIAQNEPRFAFLTDAQRAKAAEAFEAGIRCVLAAQVVQDGKKTAWCAQHDAITLLPVEAREFEPATLSGLEGARVLRFLMTISPASPELVDSIESGLTWLDRAKITGIKKTRRDGKTLYISDPTSTEIYWARFYDLKTGRPIFPGRGRVVYATFEELVAATGSPGYDYYGTQPASVLTNGQKEWRKMLESKKD